MTNIQDLTIDFHQMRPLMFDSNLYELHVRMIYNGEEYHFMQQLPIDDLHSVFDMIWEHAGRMLKEKIMENKNVKLGR